MLHIKTFTFNPFSENTYILYNEEKKCVIIDPGCYSNNEEKELFNFIKDNGLTPTLFINTHCHIDHVWGNEYINHTYNLPLHIHQYEQPILDRLPEVAALYQLEAKSFSGQVHYIKEGNIFTVGKDVLITLHTPGHSPGSICLYNEQQEWLMGGDVLFKESIGRTDLPGGDHQTLIQSIKEKLWLLPNSTVVYSGHGPTTTIGYEKQYNPFLI